MTGRLLIEGGLLVDPSQGPESRLDLLLSGARVEDAGRALGSRPGLKGVPRLNARGCWVLPGLIDLHAHLREPGREEDETIESGSRAAAAGGFATVLAMPNTEPPADTPARIKNLLGRIRRKASVNVLPAAALTAGRLGLALADLSALAEAGARAFSDDGSPVASAEILRLGLLAAREVGLPVLDHAEDAGLSGAGVLDPRAASRFGLPGIPPHSEVFAVRRDMLLREWAGGPLHLCHVSCRETVEILRLARENGVPVTSEACPHHFTLCAGDVPGDERGAADFKMNPPLRGASDRDAVREALLDGVIDAVATDHAPHSPAKKAAGLARAPFGVIGLETALPLSIALFGSGVSGRRRLVEALSAAPARILGLKTKGRLSRGADADVTLVDPEEAFVVAAPFVSKSRNSPFLGMKLKGRARALVVGGRIAFLRPRGGGGP